VKRLVLAIILGLCLFLLLVNNVSSQVELSLGYIRYIPLQRNWTGSSNSGYSGKEDEGWTCSENGFYGYLMYIPNSKSKVQLMCEIAYWQQILREDILMWPDGGPYVSHYLNIIPISFNTRVTPINFVFKPYFDVGGGLFFQNLTSENEMESSKGMTLGLHFGSGFIYEINSFLKISSGGRIFFTDDNPSWISNSSLVHHRIDFDGLQINVNAIIGVKF